MRNVLLILAGLLAVFIAVVSIYLTPDDLRGCEAPTGSGKCQKADAIVAVSGGNTSVRTAEAIRLYKEGWAETVIFSGAAADTSGPSNAEVMRRQALAAGVPASAIEVESSSQTTKENAERTRKLLVDQAEGAKRIILVTSPYHQRRASLEFRALAGEDSMIINHPTPDDPDWPLIWWLTPRGWWLAGGELVKIIAFYAGESR